MLRTLLICALLAVACSASAGKLALDADALDRPCGPPCCGEDCSAPCSNAPFEPTDCKTTRHGPARANIVVGEPLTSTNMLYCPGGSDAHPRPYALCFFSGPPVATGLDPSVDNVLTCTPDYAAGVANCACQVYSTSAFYVDINSILNRGAFQQTRQACGRDGSGCKNIAVCDAHGRTRPCTDPPCPPCPAAIAPVCAYVANQSSEPANGLYPPGPRTPAPRVDLVSAFSFAMGDVSQSGPYRLGSTKCGSGVYAGCMTAPCRYGDAGSTDGSVVQCACPMWEGEYQIGQSDLPADLQCPEDQDWVWSAANSVPPDPQPSRAANRSRQSVVPESP